MESATDNCSVKVAVHIRPHIGDERLQGSRECLYVVPGMPQVQIGTHSFTFDHVYGGRGSPSTNMFEECIAPLVDDLFQGYNGTVLAYGQTGSGKTYTMGTGLKENSHTGVIQQVMNALFSKIEKLQDRTQYHLRVSFIEILKEEVRDLLDSTHIRKSDTLNYHTRKGTLPGKSPIQIRETSSGVITLSGVTEVSVSTLKDMLAYLKQGSFSRATRSTNMNNQSSRSHAIFTITLEQMHKAQPAYNGEASSSDMGEEYIFAKLHLVDLAGSERAKRTGSDGHRFKEGIHINKGLLALGNVISALGDEKKMKEGLHIPYRDSKLTRLLQDSLGGNSKTFMIACVSPADVNADETLNTLKYADHARKIQNKPCINKDLLSDEMQKMQQQLEYLQTELTASRRGASFDEIQALKKRISWLEATNEKLSQKLHEYHKRCAVLDSCEAAAQEGCIDLVKRDGLKRSSECMESPDYLVEETNACESYWGTDKIEIDWEHALLQNTLDNELNELNKDLEQKESEMKLLERSNSEELKQHFEKKIMELEQEKKVLQEERDSLLAEMERRAAAGDPACNLQTIHKWNLQKLEAQILDLKKKQDSQFHLLKEKERSDAAAKRLQDEIRCIKAQKVQLQQKIKQEAERFRQWKASHEKEVNQLKREGRRNQFERHKLQAINQRQKMVLQRKTVEAATATKRLKELFKVHKSTAHDNLAFCNRDKPTGQGNGKSVQRQIDHELEVLVHVHAVKFEYERQTQIQATLAEELAVLQQADQFSSNVPINSLGKNGCNREPLMSPSARLDRIASLENMVRTSSACLISMASQLSETDECRRAFTFAGHGNLLRSMADARNLLQYVFNVATDARCRLWEKEEEIKELKVKSHEVTTVLQQSEPQTEEIVKKQQAGALTLATSSLEKATSSQRQCAYGTSGISSMLLQVPEQSKYSGTGIADKPTRELVPNRTEKMLPTGQFSTKKKVGVFGRGGKLWKWKRSHDRWLLQFRWKWQKPWELSEWVFQEELIPLGKGLVQGKTDSPRIDDNCCT